VVSSCNCIADWNIYSENANAADQRLILNGIDPGSLTRQQLELRRRRVQTILLRQEEHKKHLMLARQQEYEIAARGDLNRPVIGGADNGR
jgi:hypothetical protein